MTHAPATTRRTPRDLALGTLALAALLAAVGGLPVALYSATRAVVGERDGSQLFLGFLLVVAWYYWAAFTLSVGVEGAAQLRGRVAPRVPGLAGSQQLAASLVTTVTVLLLANPATPSVSGTPPSTAMPPAAAAAIYPTSYSTSPAITAPSDTAKPAPAIEPAAAPRPADMTAHLRRHLVERGDTLWSIAETQLGDGEQWRQIATLNYDRPQPDGHTLTDAHWIRPGWELLLPDDRQPTTHATPVRHPVTHTTPPDHSDDASRSDDAPHPSGPPDTDAAQPRPTDPPSPPRPTPAPVHVIRLPDTKPPRHGTDHRPPVVLPDGGLVAAGFASGVSAALLAARLQRRRRRTPARPAPGLLTRDPLLSATVTTLHRAHSNNTADADLSGVTAAAASRDTSPAADRRPLRVPLAIARDGRTLDVDLDQQLGLGLTGPGAANTARAVVAHLLTTATRRVHLLATDTAARFVPGIDELPHTTRVTDTAELTNAMHRHVVARTRLLDSYDLPSLDRLLDEHPDEAEPYLLVLSEPPEPDAHAQWAALLGQGAAVGLGALILGSWLAGGTVVIDDAGQITDTAGDTLADLVGTRAVRLSAAACIDTLRLIAHATGTSPPPDLAPAAATKDDDGERVATLPTPTAPQPVRLHLFGLMRVTVGDRELDSGLRSKARELLAFLALHPRGVTEDQAVDALWPDADLDRAHAQFRTALANLRKVLRDASDRADSKVVEHHTGRYQLDTTLVAVDVWDFQHALTDAAAAGGSLDEQRGALTLAADLYDGELLDRTAYLWAEPAREDLRRRAVDTLVRLADTHADSGERERATAYYERAIGIEPYGEDLYRRLMRVYAALGRSDAIHRTYRTLESRLTELDADPDPASEQLLVALTRTDAPRRATATSAPTTVE
jgi:DNA-binding SARP family transcriptional activator